MVAAIIAKKNLHPESRTMSDNGPSAYFYDDKNGLGAKARLFGADEDDAEFGLFHAKAEVNAKKLGTWH